MEKGFLKVGDHPVTNVVFKKLRKLYYIQQLLAKGEVHIGDYLPTFAELDVNNCDVYLTCTIFRGIYQELQINGLNKKTDQRMSNGMFERKATIHKP